MVLQPRMDSSETIHPKTRIDTNWVEQLKAKVAPQPMVLVHLKTYGPMQYRIWPTTYLFDQHSEHRSKLLHIEHLTIYPDWSIVESGKVRSGLLVFEGLPKSCTVFDFREVIPESGAFEQLGIPRHASDIYTLELR